MGVSDAHREEIHRDFNTLIVIVFHLEDDALATNLDSRCNWLSASTLKEYGCAIRGTSSLAGRAK